jgi:hypothetical protein
MLSADGLSAFGIDHGVSKSFVPGPTGYKRAVALTRAERKLVAGHTQAMKDDRGLLRYAPTTTAELGSKGVKSQGVPKNRRALVRRVNTRSQNLKTSTYRDRIERGLPASPPKKVQP